MNSPPDSESTEQPTVGPEGQTVAVVPRYDGARAEEPPLPGHLAPARVLIVSHVIKNPWEWKEWTDEGGRWLTRWSGPAVIHRTGTTEYHNYQPTAGHDDET